MVLIKNKVATGFDSIDKEPDVEVPRDILDEMQAWISEREYDDDDMLDMHRSEEFDDYVVDREHFRRSEDDVTIIHNDRMACVYLSDFLDL